MPRGDGTGPMGLGPMTGRAAGYCAGYPAPGFANSIGGRLGLGLGRGRGMARGFGFRAYPYGLPYGGGYGMPRGFGPGFQSWGTYPYYGMEYGASQVPPEQELQMLKDNAQALQQEMEEINKRITELSRKKK